MHQNSAMPKERWQLPQDALMVSAMSFKYAQVWISSPSISHFYVAISNWTSEHYLGCVQIACSLFEQGTSTQQGDLVLLWPISLTCHIIGIKWAIKIVAHERSSLGCSTDCFLASAAILLFSFVPRPSRKAEWGIGVLNDISCHMGRGLRHKECHSYIFASETRVFWQLRLLHGMVYKDLIRSQSFLGKLRTSCEVSFFTSNLVQNTIT